LVQLETLAQFGIFLILFVLGLEFSVSELRGTWREALQSTLAQAGIIIAGAIACTSWLPLAHSEVTRADCAID